MRQLLKFLGWVSVGFVTQSAALPEDTNKAIHIVADTSSFNYKSGFDIYEGNVIVDQGETHLKADRLTTQKNIHHKLEETIAYGTTQPAHYWTIPSKGDIVFDAQAQIIKFYPLKSTVVVEGDVIVTQGKNSFHGPIIIYNIKDQTVSAPATKKGRATIVIEPTKIQ